MKLELTNILEQWIEGHSDSMTSMGDPVKHGMRMGFDFALETLKDLCHCGNVIFADTEDMRSPLCYTCFTAYNKLNKVTLMEELIEELNPEPKLAAKDYECLTVYVERGSKSHKLWQDIHLKKYPENY